MMCIHMNKCIVCSNPTTNPKFCSRSCAAKHNNTVTPKRKPEGKCSQCNAPVSTQKRYCDTCLEEIRVKQVRESQNIRRWTTVSGEWAEQPVQSVAVRKKIVFQSNLPPLEATDPVGKLLDRLIGLCFSDPAYLRHEDAARHIALLNELKLFNCTVRRGVNRGEMKAEDLPINDLGHAIAEWVQSYFNDIRCSLLPAYALDTAMFIRSHLSGHYELEPELWEIEPMMADTKYDIFGFIDTRFKSNFTSRFGGTVVRCRVPEGCAITFQQKSLFAPGEEFCAVIKRCHLSTNFQDAIFLRTEVANEQIMDLGFWFVGEVLLSGEGSLYQWFRDPESCSLHPVLLPNAGESFYDYGRFDLSFPAVWVHSAGRYDRGEIQLFPVPRWDAEIGKTPQNQIESVSGSTIQ